MDAKKFIAEIQTRFYLANCWRLGLVVNESDTGNIPHKAIEDFLRDHLGFQSFTEDEISSTENNLHCKFPELFREYLLKMGKFNFIFDQQDIIDISEYPEMIIFLKECIEESNEECRDEENFKPMELIIPENAIIFMQHQGYQYFYILPEDSPDPTIYALDEDEIRNLGLFSESLLHFSETEKPISASTAPQAIQEYDSWTIPTKSKQIKPWWKFW